MHAHFTSVFKGFAARLPPRALRAVRAHEQVDYVEVDQPVVAKGEQADAPDHLDRIDERLRPLDGTYRWTASGRGVTVYVVDSGIRRTHREFRGRVGRGHTVVHDGQGTSDCNGHGTHVSGVVAGTTFGVAKGATIEPVRVFECWGHTLVSKVVAGLDWIVRDHRAGRPAVANLSLGGTASRALDDAARRLLRDRVTVVAAGVGNGGCYTSPGRVPDVLAVSSVFTGVDFTFSWVSEGRCLDLFAPGSEIVSAWITGDRATEGGSGGSRAIAMTSGVAATYLQRHPRAAPARVVRAIKQAATQNVVYGHYSGTARPLLHSLYPSDDAPVRPPSGELVTNGGFEDGSSGWTTTGPVEISDSPDPAARTGSWRAHFSAAAGAGELRQTGIRIPDQADVQLTFKLLIVPTDGTYADGFEVWLSNGQHAGDSRLLQATTGHAEEGYIEYSFDVTAWAGEEAILTFKNDDMGMDRHTHWYLDDVSLTAGSG